MVRSPLQPATVNSQPPLDATMRRHARGLIAMYKTVINRAIERLDQKTAKARLCAFASPQVYAIYWLGKK